MYIVLPQSTFPGYFLDEGTKAQQKRYVSDEAKVLGVNEIKNLLGTLSG